MLPLAELLRPKSLAEIIGQRHLVQPGAPLAELVAANKLPSLILWGPPGVGKTTLANILMASCDCHALKLSAVFSGIKEIKQALELAEEQQRGLFAKPTVLFVDEIHRFNTAQQDAFLQHLEQGQLILIGATTENPSFELNNALLSRLQVFVLEPLTPDDLRSLIVRALKHLTSLKLTADAVELLISLSDGDARRVLNLLELLSGMAKGKEFDAQALKQLLPKHQQRFDKGGEEFYNQISALHKAIRGSNPDAALYWFGRMLTSGAAPLYLGRRLLRIAWEDIGFADTNAVTVVNNAVQTYERLGSPEGDLALAGAVIYLAATNKSNSLELAYNKLREYLHASPSAPVPLHLRNSASELMTELGYGQSYRYAHDFPHHYVPNEDYFPPTIEVPHFYQPSDQGFEQRIRQRLDFLRQLDQEAVDGVSKSNGKMSE